MKIFEAPPKRTFVLEMDELDARALIAELNQGSLPPTPPQQAILEDLLEQLKALNL